MEILLRMKLILSQQQRLKHWRQKPNAKLSAKHSQQLRLILRVQEEKESVRKKIWL